MARRRERIDSGDGSSDEEVTCLVWSNGVIYITVVGKTLTISFHGEKTFLYVYVIYVCKYIYLCMYIHIDRTFDQNSGEVQNGFRSRMVSIKDFRRCFES